MAPSAELLQPAAIDAPLASAASAPEPGAVTLASVPTEVDATWWRRHAHLVRDRHETGRLHLVFVPGTPVERNDPSSAPPAPPAEAFARVLGQEELVVRLRHTVEASRARGRNFPHAFLTGPAGIDRATIARGIAAACERPFVDVAAPAVVDRSDLIRLLAGLAEGTVLFLDEFHLLPRPLLDVLLRALSERGLALVLTEGPVVRAITLRLPTFTLVASTADAGEIQPALISRFGLREALARCPEGTPAKVACSEAAAQGADMTSDGARPLARASRRTRREALRLVGREHSHLAILSASPLPIPVSRLSRSLGTTLGTQVKCVEPWSFARGLVRTTPGGRAGSPYVRRDAPNVRQTLAAAFSTA